MRGARTLISTLLAIATGAACVVAIGSTWMHRQLLNTGTWTSSTVTVLRDPGVRYLTADFLATELVTQAVSPAVAPLLPAQLRSLSAKKATTLARSAALAGLRSGDYEPLWRTASRRTHRQFVRWLDGQARTTSDPVDLDLQPAIERLAKQIGVPDGAVQAAVAQARGVRVPLVQRGQFDQARADAHRLQQASELALPLVTILAALSVALAAARRTALVRIGLAVALAGLIVIGGAPALRSSFEQGLTDGGAADAIARAIWSATSPALLREGWFATAAGAVTAILAFATRPGRGRHRSANRSNAAARPPRATR